MILLYLKLTVITIEYFSFLFCFFLISTRVLSQENNSNFTENAVGIYKGKIKSLYEIDENNRMIFPTRFSNNILYSFFEVQGNLLSSKLALSKNKLEFEIVFTSLINKIKTGGTSKDIPEVFGYPIFTVQRALLRKQK